MPRYRTTIHSSRPATWAFDYMANFANSAEWDPGVLRAEQIGDGPVGLGTKFALVTSFLGRELPLEYAVTTFAAHDRVVLTAETPSLRSVDTITVVEDAAGSSVSYDAVLEARGPLRLAQPLLALVFSRIGDRARDGLAKELNP